MQPSKSKILYKCGKCGKYEYMEVITRAQPGWANDGDDAKCPACNSIGTVSISNNGKDLEINF